MPPKKSKQSKAEKRALQEQQRAVKAANRRTGSGDNARDGRKHMAEETVRITETGVLPLLEGERDISSLVHESVAGTCSYSEHADVPQPIPKRKGTVTTFQVVNTTTLNAAYSILEMQNDQDETTTTIKEEGDYDAADENVATTGSTMSAVAALNFASAKNPGGGFLRGAMAQEESLALHSGLYTCLKGDEMYAFHQNSKKSTRGIYSDWVIFSPNVPVFRREGDGSLMDAWPCSIITCPCINNNVDKKFDRKKNKPVDQGSTNAEQGQLLKKRAKRMLEVVAAHHEGPLVLGAWGCGVFGQDPNVVARIFSELLRSEKKFVNRWPIVVFAVLDRSKSLDTLRAFEKVFGAAIEAPPLATQASS